MNEQLIKTIAAELAHSLTNRSAGRIFQLSRLSVAIDFRTGDNQYLFVSVDPATNPRLYIIERRPRDMEKQAINDSSFASLLRKYIGGAQLTAVAKDENERIVRFLFAAPDALGNTHARTIIAQLTGATANLLLVDEHDYIIDMLRTPRGEGVQQIGDQYEPPKPSVNIFKSQAAIMPFDKGSYATVSEAADVYYLARAAAKQFDTRAAALAQKTKKLIAQKEKLRRSLQQDIVLHGDAETHKRTGDLLLANLSTAERRGARVTLTDYYAEGEPRIEIEVDENSTLQEEAARLFTRYGKAKRAAREISARLVVLDAELEILRAREAELNEIIMARDEAALDAFDVERKIDAGRKKEKQRPPRSTKAPASATRVRRYRSSDGYEILVGRAARDNDELTFRTARPYDLWLHAADYPGSHVVVRNPTRKEIPHRTIIEAAELAANFSQANTNAKVDVHYTQRKFLSKPKNSAPGLVRMSAFRSLAVEPREILERI
jgi:predicted ribosome quality control (RQC) complex YloA/Tae2 family protein